jgi:hypothetical protein
MNGTEPNVIKLRVECIRGMYLEKECIRWIEIREDHTLYDLHRAIQKAVRFDDDHLWDFYAGRGPRNRARTFAGDDDPSGRDYADVTLKDVYPLDRHRLYYLFDYGDHWLFEIKKERGTHAPVSGVRYPRVIEAVGPNPRQYGGR